MANPRAKTPRRLGETMPNISPDREARQGRAEAVSPEVALWLRPLDQWCADQHGLWAFKEFAASAVLRRANHIPRTVIDDTRTTGGLGQVKWVGEKQVPPPEAPAPP